MLTDLNLESPNVSFKMNSNKTKAMFNYQDLKKKKLKNIYIMRAGKKIKKTTKNKKENNK